MKKQTLNFIATGLLTLASSLTYAQVGVPTLSATEKYTVMAVAPDTQGMSKDQVALVKMVKEEAQKVLPNITGSIGGAFASEGGINKIFSSIGETLQSQLGGKLETMKKSLPEDAIYMSVYVLPWDISSAAEVQNSVLSMVGPVQELNINRDGWDDTKNANANFYGKINSKIRAIQLGATDKAQLQSIAIHIKLQRDGSEVRVQILSRLKQMSQEFIKDNEQVHIKKLEIFGNEAKSERPMALVSITQALQDKDQVLPKIVVDLGQYGGVSGGLLGYPGSYQILANPWKENDCQSKLNSTPALTGTLAKGAVGNNKIQKALGKLIDGTAIKFRILNLNIDPATLRIAKMHLAMEVGSRSFPQCLTAESVNTQFQGEANAAIEAQLATLYKQDDMTDDLMAALYN